MKRLIKKSDYSEFIEEKLWNDIELKIKSEYWDEYFDEIVNVEKYNQLNDLSLELADRYIKENENLSKYREKIQNIFYDLIMEELDETGHKEDIDMEKFYS